MILKSHAIFEEKLTCDLENDMGIWQIFTRTIESVKIGPFMESFCPKWKMHELKIYRGVMCNEIEE